MSGRQWEALSVQGSGGESLATPSQLEGGGDHAGRLVRGDPVGSLQGRGSQAPWQQPPTGNQVRSGQGGTIPLSHPHTPISAQPPPWLSPLPSGRGKREGVKRVSGEGGAALG